MEMTRLTGQRIALYILFFMVLVGPSFFPFKVPFVGQDDVSQWVAYSFAINIGLLAVLMVVPHFRTTVATSFGPLKRPFETTSMTSPKTTDNRSGPSTPLRRSCKSSDWEVLPRRKI